MRQGAPTPEDLETMFEDAFVVRDRNALAQLFEDDAVLVKDTGAKEARGEAIALAAAAMWASDLTYLADSRRVVQTRDTALVIGTRSVSVLRRGSDGRWRYAISLLDTDDTTQGTDP